MSILINKTTRVVTQGITGKTGQFHTRGCVAYANGKNCFVAGVNPKKAGEDFEGIPIYATVKEAKEATGATVSVIYVPPPFAAAAIDEAVDAGLDLVDLATLGTVADIVPLVGENRALVSAGVRAMRDSARLGIAVLASASGVSLESLNAENIARAKVLAKEIQDSDPDLIGLQEVALWRIGGPGALDGPVTPATEVVYDFLASLQIELYNLGLQYSVVQVQSELDAEVPSALGFDIRLTQRDVILAKAGLPADELSLSNAKSANYATNLTILTVAGPVKFTRGWTSVDATVNGRTFRFINTQLEGASAFHRFVQSNELLSGPANTGLSVVLAGDLNSYSGESGPFLAYANLIRAGFVDTWTQANPSNPGFTCCNASDLLNPTPTLVIRVDHVLTRPSVGVFRSWIVGIDQDNRTPSGLWPSDHAGVVASLRP